MIISARKQPNSSSSSERMAGKIFFVSALDWAFHHIWFSDIALALSSIFIFTSLLHRLTSKGPMLWPVMGIIPTLFFHINDVYNWGTAVLIRAGGTFRYRGMWMCGCHGAMTVDPANVEYMLKTRFKNFPKGNYYRERFEDLLGGGIFNADDDSWREQRRLATLEMHSAPFVAHSFRSVQGLVHRKLLKVVDTLATSGGCVDLQDVLLRFTFDNICAAAFGVDPGCLAPDLPEIPFARAFEEATESTLFRFVVPPFVWKPMRFFGIGTERRLREAVRVVHDFAEKTVSERRAEMSKTGGWTSRCDLLSRIIAVGYSEHLFSDKFLKDFCISIILAGRDTSSVALAWFFWLISKNPEAENRILAEINEISEDHGRPFTEKELRRMVYLQAALTESLRLYPSVPVDFKEAVEDDVLPDGTEVKRGARVFYSIFSMGRMESIWGKDCREFKPERWIKEDGELVRESQFKYPVFNGGPRLCIGKKLAFMQMKMVAASVLMRYSVQVVEGHEVIPKLTTTLYMKNGLLVTFKPR